uniref:Uncharacterized protein n=1 Tax=Phytophthora ramorum TaxID=164328 RepID=H3H218_PHYRM
MIAGVPPKCRSSSASDPSSRSPSSQQRATTSDSSTAVPAASDATITTPAAFSGPVRRIEGQPGDLATESLTQAGPSLPPLDQITIRRSLAAVEAALDREDLEHTIRSAAQSASPFVCFVQQKYDQLSHRLAQSILDLAEHQEALAQRLDNATELTNLRDRMRFQERVHAEAVADFQSGNRRFGAASNGRTGSRQHDFRWHSSASAGVNPNTLQFQSQLNVAIAAQGLANRDLDQARDFIRDLETSQKAPEGSAQILRQQVALHERRASELRDQLAQARHAANHQLSSTNAVLRTDLATARKSQQDLESVRDQLITERDGALRLLSDITSILQPGSIVPPATPVPTPASDPSLLKKTPSRKRLASRSPSSPSSHRKRPHRTHKSRRRRSPSPSDSDDDDALNAGLARSRSSGRRSHLSRAKRRAAGTPSKPINVDSSNDRGSDGQASGGSDKGDNDDDGNGDRNDDGNDGDDDNDGGSKDIDREGNDGDDNDDSDNDDDVGGAGGSEGGDSSGDGSSAGDHPLGDSDSGDSANSVLSDAELDQLDPTTISRDRLIPGYWSPVRFAVEPSAILAIPASDPHPFCWHLEPRPDHPS